MRPGIFTTEFWLTVIVLVLTNLGALEVPDRFRWIISLGAIIGYALSRGLAKYEYGDAPPVVGDPEAVSKLDQLEQENLTLKAKAAAEPPKPTSPTRKPRRKAASR